MKRNEKHNNLNCARRREQRGNKRYEVKIEICKYIKKQRRDYQEMEGGEKNI